MTLRVRQSLQRDGAQYGDAGSPSAPWEPAQRAASPITHYQLPTMNLSYPILFLIKLVKIFLNSLLNFEHNRLDNWGTFLLVVG